VAEKGSEDELTEIAKHTELPDGWKTVFQKREREFRQVSCKGKFREEEDIHLKTTAGRALG